MERKFTDDEIVKALNCCGNQMHSCSDRQCKAKTMGNAVELIVHQKAEIERLECRNGFLENEYKNQGKLFWERVGIAKSEAIKEFAERLKRSCFGNPYLDDDVLNELTDSLVNEMTNKLEENNNER